MTETWLFIAFYFLFVAGIRIKAHDDKISEVLEEYDI